MQRAYRMGCFPWIRLPIQLALLFSLLMLAALACGAEQPPTPPVEPTPAVCDFDGRP